MGEEYHLLDADEVLAFQAERELVWIVTAKQRLLATQSLRAIDSRLGAPQFQRVHRNAIVNVNHVRKMAALSSQRWRITLSNALQITVSKRQAHNIRKSCAGNCRAASPLIDKIVLCLTKNSEPQRPLILN